MPRSGCDPAHQRLDADQLAVAQARPWAGSAAPARRRRSPGARARAGRAGRGVRVPLGRRRARRRCGPPCACTSPRRRAAAASTSSAWWGNIATPTLASRRERHVVERKGSDSTSRTRWARLLAPRRRRRPRGAGRRTRRRRAGRRVARGARPARSRLAAICEEPVADVVAERVVDLLEAVEVEQEQADRPAAAQRPRRALRRPLDAAACGWPARSGGRASRRGPSPASWTRVCVDQRAAAAASSGSSCQRRDRDDCDQRGQGEHSEGGHRRSSRCRRGTGPEQPAAAR